MELTLDEVLQKAVEAHRAGQIQEADRLYTAMLQDQPKHPDVNHNMGVLAVGADKIQEALLFFKTALEANPGTGQYWLSYIDALIQLDQIADAQTVLDQAKGKGASGEAFEQREQRLNELNETHLEADGRHPWELYSHKHNAMRTFFDHRRNWRHQDTPLEERISNSMGADERRRYVWARTSTCSCFLHLSLLPKFVLH